MEQSYAAIVNRLVYSAICLFLCALSDASYAQQHSMQEILALLERGQFSSASHLLQTNLQLDSTDTESRMLLGSLMEHNGLRIEAIYLWQKGLQNNANDYPLLMAIGESYFHEAEMYMREYDAPSSLLPAGNAAPYLDSAIAYFRQAAAYYPHEAEPLRLLANAYQSKGDYEQALHHARLLSRIFPADEKNHTLEGLLLIQTENYEQAEAALQKSLALNPRYMPAQKAMAELMLLRNRAEEAGAFMRQAAFYEFSPPFIRLPFHEKNYEIYARLASASAEDNEDELRRLFLTLLDDESEESTRWLALMFWHRLVPADLDEIGWEAFAKRGLESQRLIMEMAQNTENRGLLDRLCKQMAELNIPGAFEFLITLLPKDKMMDSPLRVAYRLAALGNELAIPYLIRELQDDIEEDDDGYHFSKEGRQAARQRAALALSYFNTDTTIETLRKGLQNSQIKPYCAAALYRLTMEEQYLEPLRQMAHNSKKDVEIAHFLRFIGTGEANRLARLME